MNKRRSREAHIHCKKLKELKDNLLLKVRERDREGYDEANRAYILGIQKAEPYTGFGYIFTQLTKLRKRIQHESKERGHAVPWKRFYP